MRQLLKGELIVMFRVAKISFAVVTVLAQSQLAYAENAETIASAEDSKLERIEVRAYGLKREVVEMAGPVTVLSGEELLRRTDISIGETLKYEVGVHANYYGPVASRPVIRGLDGARVQVVHNGMGTGDVSREGPDHTITADAVTAQQIEVLRGPATLLYGSGAIGGVINVVDNRIPQQIPQQSDTILQTRFGTAASDRSLSFAHDNGAELFAWHIDGNLRKGNDYKVPLYQNDAGDSSKRLRNSWSEHQVLNLGSSYIAERGFVGVSYGVIKTEYGLPEGPAAEYEEGEYIKLNQQRVALASEYRPVDSLWQSVTADIALTDYDHAEYEGGQPGTEFLSEALELRSTATYELAESWRGIVGYHGNLRDYQALGDETFTPNTDTDSHALFMLHEKRFGVVKLEFGSRYEQLIHQAYELEDSLGSRDLEQKFNLFSWSFGAVYDVQPNQQLTLSYSQAQRAPAANELYANGIHIGTRSYEIGVGYDVSNTNGVAQIIHNPNLAKAEQANNIDLGWRGQFADVSTNINLFYNQIDNYAFLANLGFEIADFAAYQYQQQNARLHGIEASISWQITPEHQVTLIGDTVVARLRDGGYLPRVPSYRLGAEYAYRADSWGGQLGLTHYGKQDRLAENETPTAGYTVAEAGVNYYLDWQQYELMAFAKLQNITNRLGFVHSSFIKEDAPLPGRQLVLGLRLNF
ncbi:ligand-gated channel [Alishewanella tabrizica]|uniref:Ligand-gated channel n=2 Tax=Alishewanella tabrizica TaxID=671278 RepID=A0ABQ2WGB5_9ALTE|nr:ligand-gated channel [Alishewanella tabrizica]